MKVGMPRTLALTGATGFIGTTLLRRLNLAGWRVRALHRAPTPRTRLAVDENQVRWIRGSLDDLESLKRLLTDAEAVVHCAGAVRGASADAFNHVNVDGVAQLVQAAQQMHPAPRFLLISSLAAREPGVSWYASSKRKGEEVLLLAAGRISGTILRPPVVYGPGDRETLPLLKWMQRGFAPVVGNGMPRFSMIFAEDLAAAVQCLLDRADWMPGPFELHDGHAPGYTWQDVIDAVALVIGRTVRRLSIPMAVLKAAAHGNLVMARLFGYAPMLTPGKVGELAHPDWVCDNSALKRTTGWEPRVGLEEGMRRMMVFLHHHAPR
jgi:nucleoside-diphosphate-sugar epimerase